MADNKEQAKILANKNIGVGVIYGTGSSSIATAVYSVGTDDKSGILSFLEASMVIVGVAKAVRAYKQ